MTMLHWRDDDTLFDRLADALPGLSARQLRTVQYGMLGQQPAEIARQVRALAVDHGPQPGDAAPSPPAPSPWARVGQGYADRAESGRQAADTIDHLPHDMAGAITDLIPGRANQAAPVDGVPTLAQANYHRRHGKGAPMAVDATRLWVGEQVGKPEENVFRIYGSPEGGIDDATLVFGNEKIDPVTGAFVRGYTKYDFDLSWPEKWKDVPGFLGNLGGAFVAGPGTDYDMRFIGRPNRRSGEGR